MRELEPAAFGRALLAELPHFASDAVDDHQPLAVGAHQQLVVGLLDAGLSDHRARLDAGVLRLLELRFVDLADVAEQVRRHVARGVRARRHLLIVHTRQLVTAQAHRDDLLDARVLHEDDRPIARLAAAPVDRVAENRRVGAGDRCEQVERRVEVALRLFAVERDVERVPVVDEDLEVAVEQDAARRRELQAALVVVLGHHLELVVLRDLEDPEAHGEHRKGARDDPLDRAQPPCEVAPVVWKNWVHMFSSCQRHQLRALSPLSADS